MTAYYNEHDPFAAAWLRELIKDGLIAPGEVDERDIQQVEPGDLREFTQCHFFAGIGVWSYALRNAGWPDDSAVWTGSCPCQGFSASGKRGGFSDQRHLWPAWFRLIAECRPDAIFGEQVASKDGLAWLDVVSADLEGAGYAIGAADLCAAGFGAPHIRQRLYFVADAGMLRRDERWGGSGPQVQGQRPERDAQLSRPGSEGQLSRQLEGLGPHGVMANAEDANGRRSERTADGRRRVAEVGRPGATSDLGDTEGRGLGMCGSAPRQDGRAAQPGEFSELGNPEIDGHEGQSLRADRNQAHGIAEAGFVNGFWRDAEWLWCRDQKYRPTKPGLFPLAHGAANRVGKLRGAGNAICAPAAEEFIRAYSERAQGYPQAKDTLEGVGSKGNAD